MANKFDKVLGRIDTGLATVDSGSYVHQALTAVRELAVAVQRRASKGPDQDVVALERTLAMLPKDSPARGAIQQALDAKKAASKDLDLDQAVAIMQQVRPATTIESLAWAGIAKACGSMEWALYSGPVKTAADKGRSPVFPTGPAASSSEEDAE